MGWQDSYRKINRINSGGNADVYLVERNSDHKQFALKKLRREKCKEKKVRFLEEIRIMNVNYMIISGIMPIFEFSETDYWYTMPIAQPAMEHLSSSHNRLQDSISGIIQVSQTLGKLHEKGISHRDIKPKNILYYNDRFYLADFGLVDFPDNFNELTRENKALGAIFTIAPEMKRDPKNADGKKADVYSLAKTLWMLITKDEKGFDGTYNYLDQSHGLRFYTGLKGIHLSELEELLTAATQNGPDNRPDIIEFENQLNIYLSILGDFEQAQFSDWKALEKQLFPSVCPSSASWEIPVRIVEALNIIGATPALNHMMLSSGGGVDFESAELAPEKDCIYIFTDSGSTLLVKPKILLYKSYRDDYVWNYFLLELNQLKPQLGDTKETNEYLVEDAPAHYVSAHCEQYKVYDYDEGTPLPDGYKVIDRYLYGRFLIVFKFSPYNGIQNTYDGRHGQCEIDDFHGYISSLRNLYNSLMRRFIIEYPKQMDKKKTWSQQILQLKEFQKNPFDNSKPLQKSQKTSVDDINKKLDSILSQRLSWSFISLLDHKQFDHKVKFYFSLQFTSWSDLSREYSQQITTLLCSDGYLKEKKKGNLDGAYFIYNRQDALVFRSQCEKMINKIYKAGGIDLAVGIPTIMINLVQDEKPTHLFTKDEIRDEIQKADDRIHNRLVIDEDGYSHVIEDLEMVACTYPVRHEAWHAGNVYVGKYASLGHLDDDYISSLEGWLKYLKYKESVYVEFVFGNIAEDELIAEIKQFY